LNKRKESLSICVTCLNEEKNLRATVDTIFKANEKFHYDLDIIIFDDGSTDGTLKVAHQIAKESSKVRICSHNSPKGIGTVFVKGIILAKGSYFSLFPGDHQITKEYMVSLFQEIGKADLILSYPFNEEIRSFKRRMISKTFIKIYNLLFGLNLKYYNGPAFFRTELLNQIPFVTRFFSYHAEAVVKFIKSGFSYVEIGGLLKERDYGKSSALKFHSFLGVLLGTFTLFVDIKFFLGKAFARKPKPNSET